MPFRWGNEVERFSSLQTEYPLSLGGEGVYGRATKNSLAHRGEGAFLNVVGNEGERYSLLKRCGLQNL